MPRYNIPTQTPEQEAIDETFTYEAKIEHIPGKGYVFHLKSRIGPSAWDQSETYPTLALAALAALHTTRTVLLASIGINPSKS